MQPTTFKDHFLYWILPTVVTLVCSIAYFFNFYGLAEFIAPDFNREFGLVENIQLLLLLIIFFLCIKGFRERSVKLEKYGFLFLAFATAVIFLEEIDYGLHYIEYFSGKSKEQLKYEVEVEKKVRNLHNTGTLNGKIKFTSYVVIVVFFVLLPLIPQRLKEKNGFIHFLSPSRMIVTTAISLLVTNKIAFYIYKNYNHYNRSMDNNVTEFEEIMIYYIIMLYIRELLRKPEGIFMPKKEWRTQTLL